jgi:putative glycosyltransferase (TIGR04348 family)
MRFRGQYPHGPLIVALTGTDLYRDIHRSLPARQSLETADRLVVLQPCGRDELRPHLRRKIRVIYQSAQPLVTPPAKNWRFFDVCVLGHLRQEKDPLRTALALGLLPAESKARVIHAGQALSEALAKQARRLMARESRYRWIGEVPRWKARRLLARSRLLVLSSRMEGGANVISEAVVEGVPVLASHISGSVGLLGPHYPGFFEVGDTEALARLLWQAESEARFYQRLHDACVRRAPLFQPKHERASWESLLHELTPPCAG